MKKTLGGERLGNGKKIKVDLHGWGRSTFNQDRIWRSTMAPGVLVPCFQEIGLNGTTFDIDINTLGHTIPTIAPLFGSFKLQIDLFACPIRLYQGLLHNNAVTIGLDMSKVLLPQIWMDEVDSSPNKTNVSCLNNYLGIKGFTEEKWKFWGIPHLAYYDIFKNYYSNKQEENAKVIIAPTQKHKKLNNVTFGIQEKLTQNLESVLIESEYAENNRRQYKGRNSVTQPRTYENITNKFTRLIIPPEEVEISGENFWDVEGVTLKANQSLKINFTNGDLIDSISLRSGTTSFEPNFHSGSTLNSGHSLLYDMNNRICGNIYVNKNEIIIDIEKTYLGEDGFNLSRVIIENKNTDIVIEDFPLKNIDNARRAILAKTDLTERIILNNDMEYLPYSANYGGIKQKELSGMVLKTYQSDIFNTWLSTEYVQLINEISSITPNENGQITMDALILAKKVYNIMNRIAVSGGTYEDWQEANFGENAMRRAESPIYIGGTSAEITFEEVVSTAQTEYQPLATLGGKGIITNKKGGSIVYKCEEPCLIMGIASITPRIDYHQGNKWFMTDLDNMDNFHKPGLDGIGFQNLIANNVVGTDSPDKALAKQPAWIQYQTSYNEVFGYFAEDGENSLAHMVLRRNYETDKNGEITDFTSYIDPSKYNYAFADNSLTAQNFWIQIGFNCKSRRKMASYEIPNL